MDCRHLLAPAAAGLLLVAGARVRAEDAGAARIMHVTGGDFPALVMVVPGDHAAHGLDATPACDRIRARRVDELPPGWRTRVARVELDCEDTLADDDQRTLTAVTARAVSALKTLIPLTAPLVRVGGELVLLKGANAANEIDAAAKQIRKYGLDDIRVEMVGDGVIAEPTRVVRATRTR